MISSTLLVFEIATSVTFSGKAFFISFKLSLIDILITFQIHKSSRHIVILVRYKCFLGAWLTLHPKHFSALVLSPEANRIPRHKFPNPPWFGHRPIPFFREHNRRGGHFANLLYQESALK